MRNRAPTIAVVLAAALSCSRRSPTYEQDVRPLLARSCTGCHSPGGTGSTLPLVSYEDALRSAGHMRLAVQSRMMPPWAADNSGLCNTWRGATWLSDREVATLVAWSDGAHPRGDPQPAPEIERPVARFRADAAVEMKDAYTPRLGSGFRCFVVDPKIGRDRLLSAIRVRSTEPRSVAQIALHALDTDEQERAAARLDAKGSEPGYSCFGSSRVPGARLVASWTWDGPVLRLPEGTGLRLRARRKLVLQIHYNLIATGPAPTRTALDLEFSDRAIEAELLPLQAASFELPPGQSYARIETSSAFDRRARLLAVAPRMHTFGQTMQLDLTRQQGSSCLANFDHWSFFRQRLFEYDSPPQLLPGDVLRLSCLYTTLGKTKPVRSGEWIEDEECAAFLYLAVDPVRAAR